MTNPFIAAPFFVSVVVMVNSFLFSQVTLSIEADRQQAAGFPVVVSVGMTSIADSNEDAVQWWCGGPERFPGAQNFIVRVRYNHESEWHEVEPTNGQFIQGSGFTGILKRGESIITPLAIPVNLPDSGMDLHQERWRFRLGFDSHLYERMGI